MFARLVQNNLYIMRKEISGFDNYGQTGGENMILMNLPNLVMNMVLFGSQLYLEILR